MSDPNTTKALIAEHVEGWVPAEYESNTWGVVRLGGLEPPNGWNGPTTTPDYPNDPAALLRAFEALYGLGFFWWLEVIAGEPKCGFKVVVMHRDTWTKFGEWAGAQEMPARYAALAAVAERLKGEADA